MPENSRAARRWERARVLASMAAGAYVVLLVIAVAWWLLTDEGFGFVREAAIGGAFLNFAVLLPSFLVLDELRRRIRRSVRHHAPRPDEEVPPHPQPAAEEQPPPRTGPGHVPQGGAEAHAVPPVGEELPDHGGHEEQAPSDRSGHGRPALPARGLLGWGLLLAVGTAWELVALADPHDDLPTISAVLERAGAFPAAVWGLVALWVLLGFHLFRPD